MPRDGGLADQGTAPLFLVLLVAAFATYADRARAAAAGLAQGALGPGSRVPRPARPARRAASPLDRRVDLLGLRLDRGGGRRQPVRRPAVGVPGEPGVPVPRGRVARHARPSTGRRSRCCPSRSRASPGRSADAAAWIYKAIAAAGILAAVAAVARVAARPALAVAFVGWNPVVAVHMAGGGHNDALVAGLAAGALALAVGRRHQLAGAAWVLAALVKWVPVVFLVLVTLAARARGRPIGGARHRRGARRRGKHRDLAVRDGMARGLRPARRQRRPRDELRASVPPRAARAPGRRRPRRWR